ncbi:kinase-like domain-containing protein [Glomus cerebriforme]|uniref:Kinase-like domain-containing protein n=1 Tax=Glomus cerebriforme TaxID=658196 RepID=A0A397TA58_9GLOM|nr:kinase-like domain-containing protein [Glomus cerebriforme]
MDLECNNHEINRMKEPQNIQECYENNLKILCFKQIFFNNLDDGFNSSIYDKIIENEKYCKLCGKSFQQHSSNSNSFKLCSDCYQISSGWIESTLTKKAVPILYLPWWHDLSYCRACKSNLTSTSDCQKYCANCYIFYTGCRYCLTTNVIFGLADKSQCKKCDRILSIKNISSGNSELDDFLLNLKLNIHNNLRIDEFSSIVRNIDGYFEPLDILNSIYQEIKPIIGWIPYSQFTNVKKIAEGGFCIIYQATWFDKNLKSNYTCYKIKHHIIKAYGITKYPDSEDYMLVMQYAPGGDLHNYLRRNFTNITWNKDKLDILWQISEGLETIHVIGFIHRDFHSGNILFDSSDSKKRHRWKIGDLGLSQPANNTSSNSEIYGPIPYIAPEVFKGSAFSKESDIYCMGMIMWELTTGCKPFANVKHDFRLIRKILDGERPKITEDTPECYADLMKSCWDPDPKKRPSIKKIRTTFGSWFFKNTNRDQFNQAEVKRKELINSKKLNPEFTEILHSKSIYTSKPISSLISKFLSLQDYISIELEFDIDIESTSPNLTSVRKRNIEELNVETHDNRGKHIKTG